MIATIIDIIAYTVALLVYVNVCSAFLESAKNEALNGDKDNNFVIYAGIAVILSIMFGFVTFNFIYSMITIL